MKNIKDFTVYKGILPYSSEVFGVYQPLLGWRSKRIGERVARGFAHDLDGVAKKFRAKLTPHLLQDGGLERASGRFTSVTPATIETARTRGTDTFLTEQLARDLPPIERYNDGIWDRLLDEGRLRDVLANVSLAQVVKWQNDANQFGVTDTALPMTEQLVRESTMAGYLLFLRKEKHFDLLKRIFYKEDLALDRFADVLGFRDPLEMMDPFKDIDRVGVSPIGIVHLFRQYFYELDTFLGTPVSHVWLSPGSTVELIEVNTRRTFIERTTENTYETVVKTERAATEEDEISDAVKQENRSDTKFGMNASLQQGWIGGEANASSSLDLDQTQSKARETAHRRMRQQTEKLSTEIRQNYKSTFKTITETIDTSSKRYVLTNTGNDLINYELRRKMRQVGVQVQDMGTYLCWQAYVDDPGHQLGIAKLVHLAKDPEVGSTPPPEAVPRPAPVVTPHEITIPFVPATEDTEPEDDMDEAYRDGVEVNQDANEGTPEKVKWQFTGLEAACDKPNYQFAGIEFDYRGADILVEPGIVTEDVPGRIRYDINVRHVNFRNQNTLRIEARVTWAPSDAVLAAIDAQDKANTAKFNAQTNREFQKAFVEAARDRINKASRITPRKFEDLREEERIVVYRSLIQDMLTKGLPLPDDRTRHVVSELLNAIFDVDKMLYFVAPEWWRPRLHRSHQYLGGVRKPPAAAAAAPTPVPSGGSTGVTSIGKRPASVFKQSATKLTSLKAEIAAASAREDTTIASIDTVAWGGTGEGRADNYYITEDSEPAKLGASLGWLLQLDGDNMRNAFLNAPWVKAVIPVRPGKERAAINWLQRLHVEGTDGLDDDYVASPAELAEIPHAGPTVTLRDAINHLCDVVAAKHQESLTVGRHPGEEIDDSKRVSATPIDKVYEHGFYPLQGGFRVEPDAPFEVFDQWVEILPTDQVVPVEVTYDPKTGRQL
jgi:hypothetical protein